MENTLNTTRNEAGRQTTLTRDERAALIKRVGELQNQGRNVTQDHMTICGFFTTRAEFERHILHLEKRALES